MNVIDLNIPITQNFNCLKLYVYYFSSFGTYTTFSSCVWWCSLAETWHWYRYGMYQWPVIGCRSTIIRDLSIQKRLHIALGIAQGLGELHLAKLIHRDFKPENVLLSQSADGVYTPKIADFGVSFQLAIASATVVKDSCGTVGYDAPEVVIDNKTPSAASDIYALAFILYELLTSKRVFAKLKSAQILAKFTMHGERPHDWPGDIPNLLRQAIEKAWSVEPEKRATICEIVHAIRKSLDGDQLSCIKMLQKANKNRKKITTVQFEDFKSFELFVLNEFVKCISIDDCEAMQIFIDKLPPSL